MMRNDGALHTSAPSHARLRRGEVQKDSATPSIAHLRLLSDAMEELCSARTQEDVVRISAALAKKACHVDSISIVLTSGEQFHYQPASPVHAGSPGDKPDTI